MHPVHFIPKRIIKKGKIQRMERFCQRCRDVDSIFANSSTICVTCNRVYCTPSSFNNRRDFVKPMLMMRFISKEQENVYSPRQISIKSILIPNSLICIACLNFSFYFLKFIFLPSPCNWILHGNKLCDS